jgi:hypothetical protein
MLTYQERWKAAADHLRHARGERADVVHSLLGLLGRLGSRYLHCRRHVRRASPKHAVRRRYSGYLLYWYKSTNTDLHCRRHVRRASREHAVRRRYAGHLLSWYKSTNTDAAGASELYSRDVSLASLTFEYTFQTTGDVRPGAYAGVARRFLLLSVLVLLVVKTCKVRPGAYAGSPAGFWYSVYLFYWYKIRNTDAWRRTLPNAARRSSTCTTCGRMLTYADACGAAYADVCLTQLDAHLLVQHADV